MPVAVAIDGPAGAGKSTLARAVARKMGYIYADTGALYRAVGLAALRNRTDIQNAEEIEKLLGEIRLELAFDENGVQQVMLNGENVSGLIRTPEASMMASDISALAAVRAFLLGLQRDIALKNSVIMDGRDIATVVLPNAQVKIFLTASPEIRARRRYDELAAKGETVTYESVLADVIKRDYNDSHRDTAPLKPAEDSVIADTSNLSFEQSQELIEKIIEEKLSAADRG